MIPNRYNCANEDYLAHYGVLGMRWGVRHNKGYKSAVKAAKAKRDKAKMDANDRADARTEKHYSRNPGATRSGFVKGKQNRAAFREAEAKNIAQLNKDYAKADADYKAAVKKAKYDTANKLYSKQSKAANKAVMDMSTGQTIARTMLMGSYGSLKYTEARTRGASTGKAVASAVLHNWGNNLTYGALSGLQYLDNRAARKK